MPHEHHGRQHGQNDHLPLMYPAFSFSASLTFNKWVKFTAADIKALRAWDSGQDEGIYFHLNHPIRYVYLCAPVVAITFPNNSNRFVLLTLDDGSGAVIDVKIERLDTPLPMRPEVKVIMNTRLDEVKIAKFCADNNCHDQHVMINGQLLETGDVIKAKGLLTQFKDTRQVLMKRTSLAENTDVECRFWLDYASFVASTLARPWVLSHEALQRLDREDRLEQHKASLHEQKVMIRTQRKKEKMKKQEAQERIREVQRQQQKSELDGNALDRVL